LPFPPAAPPDDALIAHHAWNLCKGDFWPALDVLCELYGVIDVEKFIFQLVAIRDRDK